MSKDTWNAAIEAAKKLAGDFVHRLYERRVWATSHDWQKVQEAIDTLKRPNVTKP